jgi:hypothetical protein
MKKEIFAHATGVQSTEPREFLNAGRVSVTQVGFSAVEQLLSSHADCEWWIIFLEPGAC